MGPQSIVLTLHVVETLIVALFLVRLLSFPSGPAPTLAVSKGEIPQIPFHPVEEEEYSGPVYSPRACHKMFKDERRKCGCVRIVTFARWGNNVIQLLRGLQISKVCGFKTLYLPRGFIGMTTDVIRVDNITVDMKSSHEPCYANHFYGQPSVEELSLLDIKLPMDFKVKYNEMLNVVPMPDDDLIIHIRGSDIIRPGAWWSYGQPPCSYYREIIESRKWGNVTVMSEDWLNPCVRTLEGLAHLRIGRPWHEDLRMLLGARNLVVGRGSLGYMVAVLSVNIRTFYTCNSSTSRFLKLTGVQKHINCIPTDEYYNKVIKSYSGTTEQLSAMPHGKCEKWEDLGNRALDRVQVHENVV